MNLHKLIGTVQSQLGRLPVFPAIGVVTLVAVVATGVVGAMVYESPRGVRTAAIQLPSSVTLRQWETLPTGRFITGNLGSSNSDYAEGETVPFKLLVGGLPSGDYAFSVCRDYENGTKRGYLFLDVFDTSRPANPGGTITSTYGPFSGVNVTLTSVVEVGGQGACNAGQRETQVTFTSTGATAAYILWGGHLASPIDPGVGAGNGAGSYPGSSLHMTLLQPSKSLSINPSAIIKLATITVQKVVDSGTATPDQWCFNISPNPNSETLPKCPASGTDTVTFLSLPSGSYQITETDVSGYAFASGTGTNCTFTDSTAIATVTTGTTPTDATCVFHNTQLNVSIDIEKHTNGQDADTPTGPVVLVGDSVLWEYVVTNDGDVPLTNVTVTDNQGVAVSCPKTTLAVSESMTCTASGTAAAGQYANLGTATGTPPVGPNVSDSDPSHYFGAAPSIDVEKSTNGQDADNPTGPYILVGNAVNWSYLVTNDGNVPLTNVTVTDDQGVAVSCLQDTLAVAESMTCTASGTAAAGQYANLGTATGTPPVGDDVMDEDPSHYFGSGPSIDIEKHTNGQDADAPTGPHIPAGDPVLWEYVVTNDGNVPLTNVTVTDDQGVAVSCPKDTLAVGESMTCTASGTAAAGQYANLGTATGTPPFGDDVMDEDPSHYFGAAPSIDIEKHTNGQDADNPTGPYILVGGSVLWEYVVTNDGNVALTNVTVTDDQGVTVSCPKTTLAVGESMTCAASGTAAAGQYANLGTATGTPPVGDDVMDEDPSHYFGSGPSIDVEKHTNGQDADNPTGPHIPAGDPVLWEYVVTNDGNVPLTNVTVTDDQGVAVSCPKGTLAVGESMTCTASGTAAAGQYANLGTATGEYNGTTVSDQDPSHYFGACPSIDIEKHTNGQDADNPTGPYVLVGDSVLWEYVVTNDGNVPLTNVTVTDDQGVAVSCPQTELAVGESMTCTANGTAAAGQYANLGTVTGEYNGTTVTDEDPSHYFGAELAIDIEKYTNGQDADTPTGPYILVGESVLWEYVVTNVDNVPLTNVAVTDDQGVTVSCPKDTLAVGESMTCTANGTAAAGQYANVGTATGQHGGTTVSAEDPSHYFGAAPSIDIEKHTNGQDADNPTGPYVLVGGSVLWEYVVTNDGNVPLTNVTVTDDQGVAVSCPKGTLAVGESMTCTASGTAAAGQYANLGTATGTPPVGDDVMDEDPSHYFGAAPSIDIEKYTNGEDADTPTGPEIPVGDPVTWDYVVTNNGNVDLTDVEVTDDVLGLICGINPLAVGESTTCTVSGHTAQAGQYANVGTVTGEYNGTTVTDSDPSHYFGFEEEGTITIIKDANRKWDFDFTGDLGDFTLTSKGNGQDRQDFVEEPGVYTVEEVKSSFPDKYWALLKVTCEGNSVPVEVDLLNARATITLLADEHITCTFRNERVGIE